MNLQPLYDVKERLEAAAIAGTGLLGEDFRLKRAAEGLKPLAAASPVFGKIDAGLTGLLSAPSEERAGRLLDTLALVDAVAYTQAGTGVSGELEPLHTGSGQYRELSYSQLTPLLSALTTTGGGRQETIKSAWENHPEYFTDFRVLPALVAGLGDSYGEIADQNAKILEKAGFAAVPLLKEGFDPAGKKEMARRVEIISALEGAGATPWLREILPEAKKDVRAAVITALGQDEETVPLLLDLAKAERGKNREAVLTALAKQDGPEVEAFWTVELEKNKDAIVFLQQTRTEWAGKLAADGLKTRLENFIARRERVSTGEQGELSRWLAAMSGKTGPSAIAFWRWADECTADIAGLKNNIGQPLGFEGNLSNILLYCLCQEDGRRLGPMCVGFWERDKNRARYLPHAFVASFLTKSPEAVYERFSPYICTKKPLLNAAEKASQNAALLSGMFRLQWMGDGYAFRSDKFVLVGGALDPRWIQRLTHAVWHNVGGNGQAQHMPYLAGEKVESFDLGLVRLADPSSPAMQEALVPYLKVRMVETGCWYAYSRFLLQLHASPAEPLEKSLGRSAAKQFYLYNVWNYCHEAAGVVSSEDMVRILNAFLTCGQLRKEDKALAASAIPYTQTLLRAGKPFPTWDEWSKMR